MKPLASNQRRTIVRNPRAREEPRGGVRRDGPGSRMRERRRTQAASGGMENNAGEIGWPLTPKSV